MPVTLTYPGVYIEELSSGVRTIVGVATSVAAFVGSATRGPVDNPISISSFGEFEKTFGGLAEAHPMSYAVQDFYLNGGGEAVIVRVTGNGMKTAQIGVGGLTFEAVSPGAWGNKLKIHIEHSTDAFADEIAKQLSPGAGLKKEDLFHLVVSDEATGAMERFDNLTVKESARRADRILQTQSKLVKLTTALPGNTLPTANNSDPKSSAFWYLATAESGVDSNALVADDYGKEADGTGFYALEKTDIFNLLVLPPPAIGNDTPKELWAKAATYCMKRRALLLVDPPVAWTSVATARDNLSAFFGAGSDGAKYSALYFPFLNRKDKFGIPQQFVPSGAVAGVIARTDAQRGIWKAPAGLDAGVVGADSLSINLTPDEQGQLNPIGINCLRVLPGAGRVVYGARTLAGNDLLASEWKYVPVRRLALYVEETLFRGTQWVVFEPNADPLWAQVRASVGAFLHTLFRQGAFDGNSPQEAYYVRCDNKTTTPDDQNRGVVNIEVGFKPLKPAEFVVIKIQQIADQAA